jgi:hypothetical protein
MQGCDDSGRMRIERCKGGNDSGSDVDLGCMVRLILVGRG